MNREQQEKIEDIAYWSGIMAVLVFKTIVWCGIAYIIIHFAAKFW